MRLSLFSKIMGSAFIMVALMILLGGIAFWSSTSMLTAADEANKRLEDTAEINRAAYRSVKQYQVQADLIINHDLALVEEFEAVASEFEESLKKIHAMVDTPEEIALAKELDAADEEFDRTFKDGVVPAVAYELKGELKRLDGEADVLVGEVEELARKISVSFQEEFEEAARSGDIERTIMRGKDLVAVERMLFWGIKQYQNQADLIINQDLAVTEDFKESAAQFEKYLGQVKAAVDTDEEKEWIRRIEEVDAKFDDTFFNQVIPAVKIVLRKDIQRLDGESDQLLGKVDANLGKIINSLHEEAEEATAQYHHTAGTMKLVILIVVVVAVVLGSVISFLLAKSITGPINRVIEGLNNGAAQVASASTEISGASQSLAEGASEQAAVVEETTASLEQMAGMSRETSELTAGAEALMNENIEKSGQSLKAIVEVTQKMNQVEADSGQMGKIIKSIDEIAFQTNLLALNAAVEAARAGEAGAGFAVVAEEVRNLAHRAAESAKGTQELLDGTIKRVLEAAKSIKDINENFEGIVESATVMGEKIDSITNASQEVSKGVEQITTASQQMDKMTQRMATNAEETASASEEMAAQSETMRDIVAELAGLVSGKQEEFQYEMVGQGSKPKALPHKKVNSQAIDTGRSNKLITG